MTDQLIDGTLLVLTDYDDANKEMTELYDLFRRHYDNAGAL